MTTLYRPVLIETAEQADALPVGTVATMSENFGEGIIDSYVAVKSADGWVSTDSPGPPWMSPIPDAGMADDDNPWTALVPVEAEEEREGVVTYPRPDDAPWPKRTALCGDSEGDWYYRDEDGKAHDITEEMTLWLAAQPSRTRLVTPWEPA